jgi:hypothetical protein
MAGPSCDTITTIYTLTDPLLSRQPRGMRLMPLCRAQPFVSRPACGHWLSQKRKSLRSRTRGPGVLTETHRKRILRRDCSGQLLVAPPKTPTAATQASSHFLADDRPAELLASRLTRSTEDFVARLRRGRRGSWRSCCSD